MGEETGGVDYEGLNRLLGALGGAVAGRSQARQLDVGEAPLTHAIRAATLEPARPIRVPGTVRGLRLEVALRAALQHFLPGATAVVLPLLLLALLIDPFDRSMVLPGLALLMSGAAGFGGTLLAMRSSLYVHANPDGARSDIAGLGVALTSVGAGLGVVAAVEEVTASTILLLAVGIPFALGIVFALVVFRPWLTPAGRVGRPTPVGRWRKLRAAVLTGVAGSAVFSAGTALQAVFLMASGHFPPPGVTLSEALPIVLAQSGTTGFLIGTVFALLLAALYARAPVEGLRPWRVGLVGAVGAMLPYWVWLGMRTAGPAEILDDPLTTIARISLTWAVPGFVLAFGSVRLAQRSTRDGALTSTRG